MRGITGFLSFNRVELSYGNALDDLPSYYLSGIFLIL